MTADEKHISKLAGDLKYDEKHHGPGDFKGGYHKVLHAEGKAHQGPAKPDPNKGKGGKGESGGAQQATPRDLEEYLKKKEEKQKEDLLNKYKPKPRVQNKQRKL